MNKKILLFLLLLLPLLSFTSHKFYVSVTEMEYNQEVKSLQVITRVFTDDMENLLRTRYNEDLYLTKDEEHEMAEDYIRKYVSQKMEVSVNGQPFQLNYLGKKYDNDLLVLFIEIEEVPSIQSISVRNEILTDLFSDQKNVVHVEFGGMTKSLLLSRDKESGVLNFKK